MRLTARIEDAFGQRPTIYKAGRYGLGPATFATLLELGYRVDASVVPHTDFSDAGGPDFTGFPAGPFAQRDGLLELPLSVHFAGALAASGPSVYPQLTRGAANGMRAAGIAARLGLIERLRLTPEGHSLADMKRQTRAALARGERYFMLTYHSSTLLPGATPYAPGAAERDAFLAVLGGLSRLLHGRMRRAAEEFERCCRRVSRRSLIRLQISNRLPIRAFPVRHAANAENHSGHRRSSGTPRTCRRTCPGISDKSGNRVSAGGRDTICLHLEYQNVHAILARWLSHRG